MNDLILNFPREIKIKVLEDSLKENKFNVFFELSKILLDTPITNGGLESETIEKIHQEHLSANKE